ncbi:MBL fold metallo-hydrolase [Candidatus Peregrinibacteria bacterium]|nr:MBL fold metallo-hydrolase [Candidatus Peregrinibacteria bacterium]
MQIKFHGHSCLSIKNNITVLTDPYDDSTGLTLPNLKADVVTVSHNDPHHNNFSVVNGEPKVFSWPGEYETGGSHFKGIASFHNTKDDVEQKENTIFVFDLDGIRFCHLGALGTKLIPEQLEKIGDVDILFIPVGGKEGLDSKKAKEVVEQIEPRIIIPMAYHTEGNKCGFDAVDVFLKEMGSQAGEPIDVYTVKRSELPEDASKVVVIQPS